MAIKKLQSNYTTTEQSKRLLELGLPADSADCYYTWKLDHTTKINVLDNETYSELLDHMSQFTIPCWSVGRLIELLCINDIFFDYGGCSYRRGYNIINYIISQLEAEDDLDFSELEE